MVYSDKNCKKEVVYHLAAVSIGLIVGGGVG